VYDFVNDLATDNGVVAVVAVVVDGIVVVGFCFFVVVRFFVTSQPRRRRFRVFRCAPGFRERVLPVLHEVLLST
jgi:hypothetical protein